MSEGYTFRTIEQKWQEIWRQRRTFHVVEDAKKPKFYGLFEFPYPSGAGLHVGHVRCFAAMDVLCRCKRMQGYNVLFPIGFDAFGLPTENYAIKTGVAPAVATAKNIQRFTQQIQSFGLSVDWDRVIDTSQPEYYKWTQWLFLQFVKHGLAYKDNITINWCPACKIGLANEEVINGTCERCGSPVTRKKKSQWMLKITQYADRLIDDLDTVDYLEQVAIQQKHWIGRSQGLELNFQVVDERGTPAVQTPLTIFTTRPDTVYGVTYVVIAPEHGIIEANASRIDNITALREYATVTMQKSTVDRTVEAASQKTGIRVEGLWAVNPYDHTRVPIYVADYVLADYGTGAVMAVPAHDERDYAFAQYHHLPMREVVAGGNLEEGAYTANGVHHDSGILNGLENSEAIATACQYAENQQFGKRKVNYKLRDWVFSRQRYWGEPIPMVHCEHCGWVPLPESELPLTLPPIDDYLPTEEGDSPLAKATEWVKTTCPHCHGPATRETDVMPNWAGSSWYYLRYCDPHNSKAFADRAIMDYWLPVDWYDGGSEHVTLHLLYSRFWHKFFHDCGLVRDAEPYRKRTAHGMVLAFDGQKMSKSKGNVVNPDDVIAEYGADTLRTYEMFMGPYDQSVAWNTNSLMGAHRFLQKVYQLAKKVDPVATMTPEAVRILHQTIKDITDRIQEMKFNTCVSALMICSNYLQEMSAIPLPMFLDFLKLLSPFAPHLAEELWQQLGQTTLLSTETWPNYEADKLVSDTTTVVVQINGKKRAELTVSMGASEEEVLQLALATEAVQRNLADHEIRKSIYLPNKLLNIVI